MDLSGVVQFLWFVSKSGNTIKHPKIGLPFSLAKESTFMYFPKCFFEVANFETLGRCLDDPEVCSLILIVFENRAGESTKNLKPRPQQMGMSKHQEGTSVITLQEDARGGLTSSSAWM